MNVMTTQSYEIEIKSLLGGKENAEALRARMAAADPNLVYHGAHAQKNHYFIGGDLAKLAAHVAPRLEEGTRGQLEDIARRAHDFSVRTRWADGTVLLVLKASVDDTTSANGTARLEFEAKTPGLGLEELDSLLLQSGFQYQAKWSREREEYTFRNTAVTIDKNAGYGYLAEFEAVVNDAAQADQTKARLRNVM
ncbi:MAG: CYTH domain-containing protein, partial [Patescibacteria group bacterium]|nr:CYTH domain-containing protein [Patescibacteria group bacterium]